MKTKDKILKKLSEKASTKQTVHRTSKEVFKNLKKTLKSFADKIDKKMCNIDEHVKIIYNDKGEFEAELRFSGDILVFHLHSNTFQFDKKHQIWNSAYTKEDEYRSYCGVINIYNFLSDSFKYNRENDLGFLIGRIFINKEKHFFVEGKGKLSFLFNNFPNSTINEDELKSIIEEAIIFALDFELITPPYKDVEVVSLNQIKEMSQNMKLRTSKPLGFRFSEE